MGLDLKLIALGYMGETVYEQTWRSQWPIVKLVKLFVSVDKERSLSTRLKDFEQGNSPVELYYSDLLCIYKILSDSYVATALWDSHSDEYYQDVLVPIRDQFKKALDLDDKESVNFYFYMDC